MKRILSYIFIALVVSFVSCQKDDFSSDGDGRMRINVDIEQIEGESITKAISLTALTDFQPALYNDSGAKVVDANIDISSDLTQIVVDNLKDGDYTLAIFGLGEVKDATTGVITVPDNINDTWFPKPQADNACNNEYFHTTVKIQVRAGAMKNQRTTLKRVVARMHIMIAFDQDKWQLKDVTEAYVSFDQETPIYTTIDAAGKLGNPVYNQKINVLDDATFYTLASSGGGKTNGSVVVKKVDASATVTVATYEFSTSLEPNKIITIRPNNLPEVDEVGYGIKVFDKDRSKHVIQKFFQEGDSYKSIAQRSFYTDQLIKMKTENNTLTVTCFVAKTVKDVSIYATNIGSKVGYQVAWFETINAFEEIVIDLSKTPENKLYQTDNGGVIMIEKLEIEPSMRFKYASSDPFIKSINKIRWPIKIGFQTPSADTINDKPTTRFLPFRAMHARGAVAAYTNMGYVLSSPEFETEMRAVPLYDDSKKPVDFDKTLLPLIMNPQDSGQTYLNVSILNPYHKDNPYYLYGLANIGIGDLYSTVQHVYRDFDNPNSDNFMVIFHEYGHTLGYSHDSNLTYGMMHTGPINASTKLQAAGLLPYNTKPDELGPFNSWY